jgi:hypothetical protein
VARVKLAVRVGKASVGRGQCHRQRLRRRCIDGRFGISGRQPGR